MIGVGILGSFAAPGLKVNGIMLWGLSLDALVMSVLKNWLMPVFK